MTLVRRGARRLMSSAAVLLGVVLLASCDTPIDTEIAVQVTCENAGCPIGDMVLEVGDDAWTINPDLGLVLFISERSRRVRVVEPDTCEVFADFVAPPDSAWRIKFVSPQTATVEDITASGFELGPSMGETSTTRCP